MKLLRTTSFMGTGVAALVAVTLLAGCASTPRLDASPASESGKAAPTSEPTTPPPGIPHAAAVTAGTGAPAVHRTGELPDAQKAVAPPAAFSAKASYADGISLSVSGFSRGVIKSHGSGIITGAPYIVFDVSLTNGSAKPLDLSSVVVTLRYGKANTIAAPVYDEVKANDFWGTVKPGASTTADYAFQFPRAESDASLYIDLDGAHKPATFTGSIPE